MPTAIPLNPEQRAAVDYRGGAALVIAGAGSGKTRVLTSRVESLLAEGVPAEGILAFTFTNRAAREMRSRIEQAVGPVAGRLWIGTFHATAVRLLRREAAILGLPAAFTIYDREDQEGLIRRLVRESGLAEAAYRPGMVLARISDAKNALVPPAALERQALSEHERGVSRLYTGYQQALRRAGAVDFDDLIAESVRLFLEHPQVGERWSRRFQHVLVDEYQDTNHAQFRLVQCLASGGPGGGGHGNLFVVGDDDQSIYGWRGADLSNVLDFERAFPGAVTIRLEQNYRSTRTILDAANAVIAHNLARKGKTLWSEREQGRALRFILAADEAEEARRIRGWLGEQRARGRRLAECAVLYRTNAQSRALETELRHNAIRYEIVGGQSFYQRREIKDVLAYLRLLVNPADTTSFFRVWNLPRRGLGPSVQAQVEARLRAGENDPLAALASLRSEGVLRGPARAGADALLALIADLRSRMEDGAHAVFARFIERSGYLEALEADSEEELAERRAHVEELGVAVTQFAAQDRGGLVEWLSECALMTDADRVDDNADRVLLLTVHNAKGLEFPAVAIAGIEEGLMPHASSLDDASQLEEERRLFYVALTRAADEVLLSAAAYRRRFSASGGMQSWGAQVSRFIEEVPAHLLQREGHGSRGLATVPPSGDSDRGWTRARSTTRGGAGEGRRGARGLASEEGLDLDFTADGAQPDVIPVVPSSRTADSRRAIGKRVHHDRFGAGTVLDAEGSGPDMKLTVRFTGAVKKVLARFVSGGGDGDHA